MHVVSLGCHCWTLELQERCVRERVDLADQVGHHLTFRVLTTKNLDACAVVPSLHWDASRVACPRSLQYFLLGRLQFLQHRRAAEVTRRPCGATEGAVLQRHRTLTCVCR